MELRQLRHFQAVIEHRGFGRAAAALNISQSALTHSIAKLELRLRAKLFERTQSGPKLTEAGRVLDRNCRLILSDVARTANEIEALSGGPPTINVGIDKNLTGGVLGQTLADFMMARPAVVLKVDEGWGPALIPKLLAGEFDMVVSTLAGDFANSAEVRTEALFPKTSRVYISASHPILATPELGPQHLAKLLWGIRSVRSSVAVGEAFRRAGMTTPSRIMVTDSDSLTISLIRQGRLVGLVNEEPMTGHVASGEVIALPFEGMMLREMVHLARRVNGNPTPAAAQLAQELMAVSQSAGLA